MPMHQFLQAFSDMQGLPMKETMEGTVGSLARGERTLESELEVDMKMDGWTPVESDLNETTSDSSELH